MNRGPLINIEQIIQSNIGRGDFGNVREGVKGVSQVCLVS